MSFISSGRTCLNFDQAQEIQAHGPVVYVHEVTVVHGKCVRPVLVKRPTGLCSSKASPETVAAVLHSMIETESRPIPSAPSCDEAASETPSGPKPIDAPDVEGTATPLPKLQLFILLYLQLAEPITSTVIYPFVNQLVRETGITGGDERKTGYFAGLIVRSFHPYPKSLCTSLTAKLIAGILLLRRRGRLRAAVGPRVGPHRAQARAARGPARAHAVDARVRRVARVLGARAQPLRGGRAEREHRRHEEHDGGDHGPHEPRAGVPVLPDVVAGRGHAWVSALFVPRLRGGVYVGVLMRGGRPIIGGVFARPADRWPGFRESAFWRTYPYFLPCVIAASISVSAFVLAAIGLKEVSNSSCPRLNSC